MKRIIVVSDSHGRKENIHELRALVQENDYLIHLGDGATDVRELFKEFPEKVLVCRGNCDFSSPYPQEGVLEVEWVRILYCHGHTYGVKSGLDKLAYSAREKSCDVALYGHTHCADITELGGVTLINPGTMQFPLGKGGGYCYLVVHKDKCTPVLVGDRLR
ncbi:MAG: metallophosphoesterase [Clostridia bacterium]|nr:metallophosphoesterase [Clostridia bacterium]